jgi:regulatory protein
MKQRTSRAGEGIEGTYEAAVRLLAARAHSARELRIKLLRRGHAADEVTAALERLREGGHLDDAAYARALIGRRSGGRGARAIASELAAKGVDREVARTALAELSTEDQLQAAQSLAERLSRVGPADPERIGAKLLRRGFPVEVARAALRGLRL